MAERRHNRSAFVEHSASCFVLPTLLQGQKTAPLTHFLPFLTGNIRGDPDHERECGGYIQVAERRRRVRGDHVEREGARRRAAGIGSSESDRYRSRGEGRHGSR